MPKRAEHKCSVCDLEKKVYTKVSADPSKNTTPGSVKLYDSLLSLFDKFPDEDSLVFCQSHKQHIEGLARRVDKVDTMLYH